jgi:hypothetical protein
MQMMDILNEVGGLQALAREFGITESQAVAGANALAPAILGGLKRHTQSQSGGLDGLLAVIGQLGGASLLDSVLAPQATNTAPGNEILGQIFGSRDVSRTVAQQAAAGSGLDPALLRKMLPVVAMLVAGYMSRHTSGARATHLAPSGFAPDANAHPDGGLGELLDLNGDGNPLDDLLAIAGKLMR